jgi:hypothetical protein
VTPEKVGIKPAYTGHMEKTSSGIHYNAPAEPKVSKKAAFIVVASVIALAGVLIAIVH